MRSLNYSIFMIFVANLLINSANALTIKVQNVPIQEALKNISIAADICVIALSDLEGTVSLDVKNACTFAEITKLAQKCGYSTSYSEGHIYVGAEEALASYDMARLVATRPLNNEKESTVRKALHEEHPHCTVIYDVNQKTFVVLASCKKNNYGDLRKTSVAVLDEGRSCQRTETYEQQMKTANDETERDIKELKTKMRKLLKLIKKHPKSLKGWLKISLGFHKLALFFTRAGDNGRYLKALGKSAKALAKAVRLDQKSVKLRSRLVVLLCAIQKDELARHHYEIVRRLNSEWAKQLTYLYPELATTPANCKEQVG